MLPLLGAGSGRLYRRCRGGSGNKKSRESESGAMAVSWCRDVDTHTAAAAKQLRPDTVVRASVELNE